MIGRTNSSSMNSTTDVLDFTVVDGLTEPANPKEKMIWVETDAEITGWTFSATEPAGSEGLVWFLIGQSSQVAFSVTKDNPIMVYPIKARQYINNSWTEKNVKTYQNNTWIKWNSITYWFKTNEGSTNIWQGASESNGEYYIKTYRLQLTSKTYGSNTVAITTKSKIDLTNFNTLYFKADADASAHGTFGVASAVDGFNVTFVNGASVYQGDQSSKIWEVDISNLTGEYYLAILRPNGNAGSVFVYEVYGI